VGLRLLDEGRSTLEEVLRVTHAEAEDRIRAEVGAGGDTTGFQPSHDVRLVEHGERFKPAAR